MQTPPIEALARVVYSEPAPTTAGANGQSTYPSSIMAHILTLYGTTEGQTRKIASVIEDTIRDRGHSVERVASTAFNGPLPTTAFDGVIVGASVHMGHHQEAVGRFVKDNRTTLMTLPTAFFSVSLAELDAAHSEEATDYVTRFLDETGWAPDLVETVAGALRYTKYGFIKRFIMRQISKRHRRPTDTSRDFEFTDWRQVERFVDRFLNTLQLTTGQQVHSLQLQSAR